MIVPGATIGILGGGQLARMLAFEGRRMGYRIAVQDPDPAAPAATLADEYVTGALDDRDAASRLADVSDVITLDTEHVPADILETLGQRRPVRPGATMLWTIQDRLRQRTFLAELGCPQTRNAGVASLEELHAAGREVGFPAVLKTRRAGYDGKGQVKIASASALEAAWDELARNPAVLEAFVDLDKEISVLLARSPNGELKFFPIAENEHRKHVLHISRAPARISPELAARAEEIATRIAVALDHVGMMAVEFFVTRSGELLVNEIAPRTHNSGHYTFGACATSQFEQHVRAICALPLGDPSLLRPSAMLNLLGDLWIGGEPRWEAVFAHPTARLHLYGKLTARPGRKMGHVSILDDGERPAIEIAETIARALATS